MSENESSDLPDGWASANLGASCSVIQGQSPPGDTYNAVGEGLPFFQGKAEFGDLRPTPRKWCTTPTKIAEPNDTLISIRAPVGPTNLCATRACIGRGLAAIRPLGGIEPLYLLYGLRASVDLLVKQGTGSTFDAISGDVLRDHEIPLAPLPEQKRIVARIEELLSQIDAGVDGLRALQKKLRRYRVAVLKAACQGTLVPTEAELARAENRDYEPAIDLLARVLAERRARWEADQLAKMRARGAKTKDDKWKARYEEPAVPDINGLPELPDGWMWTTLESLLAEGISNGLSIKGSDTPPGVAALRLNAMTDGGFDFRFIRYLPLTDAEVTGLLVHEGDFFVARGNGSKHLVGRGTVAQSPPFPVVYPDTMMRLRLTPSACAANWLPSIWASSWVRNHIERKAKTTAGIWKISQPDLHRLHVPFPPLAEQERIVSEVERRLSVLDQMEATLRDNLKRANRLRQAVLRDAFAGKLVPQNPEDEPAADLLARIRAEREAVGATSRAARLMQAHSTFAAVSEAKSRIIQDDLFSVSDGNGQHAPKGDQGS